MNLFARFEALDRALVTHGFPPTSPWWRDTLRAFFDAGKRQLVLRVGRRGGKSSTLCRAAVVVALYGQHSVPPGDTGIVGVVSVNRDEASQRLRTFRAILDAIGVKYRPIDGGIELADRPVVFKTFAATMGSVVGGTWVAAFCDEVARWRDSDTGVNPATEVLASLRPTMATQPNARIFLSSSPLGELDAHFDAFEEADTEFQNVAHAPSWVANPTVTEGETRALEPDERIWRREYAAIPQADAEEGLLTVVQLDAVTRGAEELEPQAGYSYIAATDPATRGDVWSLVIATSDAAGKRVVVALRQWKGSRTSPLSPGVVLGELAALCRAYSVDHVWTDQHSGDALVDIGRQRGVDLIVEPWTAQSKLAAFESLRTRIANKELELPPDADLRADLLAIRKRITRAGVTLELPRIGGRHCDYAPALAMLTGKYVAPPLAQSVVSWEDLQREKRRTAAKETAEQTWWKRAGAWR